MRLQQVWRFCGRGVVWCCVVVVAKGGDLVVVLCGVVCGLLATKGGGLGGFPMECRGDGVVSGGLRLVHLCCFAPPLVRFHSSDDCLLLVFNGRIFMIWLVVPIQTGVAARALV